MICSVRIISPDFSPKRATRHVLAILLRVISLATSHVSICSLNIIHSDIKPENILFTKGIMLYSMLF